MNPPKLTQGYHSGEVSGKKVAAASQLEHTREGKLAGRNVNHLLAGTLYLHLLAFLPELTLASVPSLRHVHFFLPPSPTPLHELSDYDLSLNLVDTFS